MPETPRETVIGFPQAGAKQRRCPTCEVGEFSTSLACWACGRPYEDGCVTGLARLREYPPIPVTRLEAGGLSSWEIHETNPTIERHR